jgi:hypothetical protein
MCDFSFSESFYLINRVETVDGRMLKTVGFLIDLKFWLAIALI